MIPANPSFDAAAEPFPNLAALGRDLFDDESWLRHCESVQSGEMPPGPRGLLVHDRHMTATLTAHYGEPPSLRVLSHLDNGAGYRRKIVLTVDNGRRVVEFGLLRLNLDVLPADARGEVVARKLPLGEILARYDVLTHVEPRWFLRFAANSPVVQYFAPGTPPGAFGRLGVIHCNGQPAVELLEVVSA